MTLAVFLFALGSAVLNMAIDAAWYTPKTFGSMWMEDAKVDPSRPTKAAMTKIMGLSFISYILIGIVIGWLRSLYMGSLTEFLVIMVIFWFAFVFCIRLIHALFEQKPFRYVLITSGHDLVSLLAASAVMYHA